MLHWVGECAVDAGGSGFERYAKNDAAGSISAEMEQVVPWPALCALRRDSALGIRRGIIIPRSGVSNPSPATNKINRLDAEMGQVIWPVCLSGISCSAQVRYKP